MNRKHTSLWKKWTYLKCKSFCWNFATINLPPPMKLQLAKQCKGRSSANHRGANNIMNINNNMMSINYNTMNINGSTWKNKWTQWKPTTTLATTRWTPTTNNNRMNINNSISTSIIHWRTRWEPSITQWASTTTQWT